MGTGHRMAALATDCAGVNGFNIDDPGASGAIPNKETGIVHLVSAAAESRSLAVPDCAGVRLALVMKTDGGDITLTVASAYDESGSTSVVFSDPGQFIVLESYEVASGTYAWRRIASDGVTGPAVSALTVAGNVGFGSNATDRVTVKGIYMTPANVSVSVPSITDPDIARVQVDVSSAFSIQPAVGDAVIAIPQEALPTNCRFQGAWVYQTDGVEIVFGSEGGNVVGASKNFKFLVIDLT